MNEKIESWVGPEEYITRAWQEVFLPLVDEDLHPLANEYLAETIQSYSEEGRYYHTLAHIADCLQKLEAYKEHQSYVDMWLALLWHDEVYNTYANNNEEKSASLAQQRLEGLDLPIGQKVHDLIMVTKTHEPLEEDEALVSDIDMSILAEDPETYLAYAEAIRREYNWVPDEDYRRGRMRVLLSFDHVFYHPDFEWKNDLAKDNIRRELETLTN